MLTNHEGYHEYSGPTYSRTLSSTRDLEMTKPLLFQSSQLSNKSVRVSIEDQFQLNGFKTVGVSDLKNDTIPVALVKPPRKTTRREIFLILLCIFLFIMFLIVSIIMVKCLMIQNNVIYASNENPVLYCLTASCLRATSEITNVMGSSVNQINIACNSLSQFACGDWLDNTRLPPTSVNWNLLENIRYNQQEELRNILESNLGNISEHDYTGKFQIAYEKCLNRDLKSSGSNCAKNHQSDNDIEELLHMPQLKMDSLDQILQYTQVDLNVPIFFKTILIRNHSELSNQKSKNILLLSDYNDNSFPDFYELQDPQEIYHLKEYIFESVQIAQFSQIETLTEDFIEILKLLRRASVNTTKEVKRFPELKYVKTNLIELKELTKQTIDFSSYLMFFNHKKNANLMESSILLSSYEYFKHISDIVLQSKLSKILNFIRFSIIHKYGSFASQRFSNAKQKYMWRNSGRQHPYENWQDCIELLNSPGIAGLYQVSMKNEPKRYKMIERIEDSVMIHIKNSMSNIIENLEISQIEKQIILEKISSIKLVIPILTRPTLNAYYKNWIFSKNASLLKIMIKYPTENELSIFPGNIILHASNGLSTYSDLAQYVPEKNSIILSNILLQWPFFSSDATIPKYLEFASLGLWLAKSITDVLSYKASYFSNSGQKLKYPINITFESLIHKDTFLFSKYSHQIKEFKNAKSMKSILTIQIVESAYENFQKNIFAKEYILPHLNYSNLQTMFIRLAQNYCSKIRPEYQSWLNQTDTITEAENLKIMMLLKSYRNVYKCDSIKNEENTD